MSTPVARPSAAIRVITGLFHQPYVWAIVALLLLLVVNLTKNPAYLGVSVNAATGNLSGNVIDILRASAPIMMIAVGMTLVIATRGIDLSVGSVMAVAGAVSMEFMRNTGTGSFGTAVVAVLLALGISALLGTLNGILVSIVGLQPFITTLVMMLAGRGLAKVITSGQNTSATNETFRWIANGTFLGFPVVFVIAVLIVAVLAALVRRTALGLMIESIGINPKAARMAGIRPVGILISVYIVSAVLAGVAGIFSTASVMTVEVAKTGMTAEMDAILAVVIGGTSLAGGKFSLTGSIIGALLIATLDKTIVYMSIPSSATPAFKAVVIVIICLLQSPRVRSMFPRRRTRVIITDKETVPV
ncbi:MULTISPECIES: ABC transporter permease [unclassified Cryobacterium]|uniref:ABC transporter permease n=1 Tax=unclassified Cryobacterium TaxID=2649013 RepID=UPI00106CB158|nr:MULTISPECIES: ABC transporter permease [unclassified Cryobacterium]TFC58632.1 ABC transporter permease [Cryobacterium sp. TMB3-1-2]TFC67053.1 ABC transporter permease [Cryobacterium sp. TMB3-15]TFC73434.1 ABC transporter permease [Cryobacterium sp. TMB3-10]TFD44093.1 ABC transporter permease [Cryobacterium sp. TMB3-12]